MIAAIPATAMINVINHPIALLHGPFAHSPIIFLLLAISMISNNTTGATIPLNTAEYIKALIGSSPIKLMPSPTSIDNMITP